jgi:hypothetical protein
LQQQADSIKKLLKMLNSAGSGTGSLGDSQQNGGSNDDMSRSGSNQSQHQLQEEEQEGYEQLWELRTNGNGETQKYSCLKAKFSVNLEGKECSFT